MKNKIILKKYLIITSLILTFLLSLILSINICEYNIYKKNFNQKINAIIGKVQEKYNDINDYEIMEIINNKNASNNSLFKQYGIDLEKESVIIENSENFYKFLLLNSVLFIITVAILIFVFMKYENKKDKQISDITRYIEEINRKNYTLHIDEISEDELSILKNEIYKTTIMLKESAENSKKR